MPESDGAHVAPGTSAVRRYNRGMTAEPRTTIGRYEIVREIARGGMGVVYEARDPVLERTVALKVVQPATESGRPFEERFLAEARIAAGLQHPGIVVVHDVGRDDASGALFIALELLRGRTLADLAAAGPVDWRAVLQVVVQVARALHHAHLHGIVHRDVKPANVVVLPTGEAKVMDFGIARLETARQRLTTTGEFIGTPLYTAPEQAKTEEVDGRADVFSLASVAYTLLTGRAAFSAPTIPGIVHRVVYEEPDPASSFVAGLPADVERVLARALEKDPARRYPTAAALAEDAEDVLAGRPPRHAADDELVVVKDADSPLAALLDDGAGPRQAPAVPQPAPAGANETRDIPPAAAARERAFASPGRPPRWPSSWRCCSGSRGRPSRPRPRGPATRQPRPRRRQERPARGPGRKPHPPWRRAGCASTSTTRSEGARCVSTWTGTWHSRSA